MKKGRTKTEEIIRILRASEGMRVDDICREYGISARRTTAGRSITVG